MPPTIGGMSIPYESGQSGTASPEPVDVTIAPAKISKSVDAVTSFVKRRSQSGVASMIGTAIRTGCINSLARRLHRRLQPRFKTVPGMDEKLTAHAVVTQAAELRAGDLPRPGSVGLDRREVNGHFHSRDGVLFHAHHRQIETVDDVFGCDAH